MEKKKKNEKNKQHKDTALIALLIIAIFGFVGVTGYVIYNKYFNKNDNFFFNEMLPNKQVYYNSVTGIKYNLYNQNDSRWAKLPFNGKTIGDEGCAIMSVAVIASAYDQNITPLTIINHSNRQLKHDHPYKSIQTLTNNSFTCKYLTMYDEGVVSELKKGNAVVIYAGPNSPFTPADGHHYMALIDISKDASQIYVGNSFDSKTSSYNKSGWYSAKDVLKGRSYSVHVCTPSAELKKKYSNSSGSDSAPNNASGSGNKR